MEENKEILELLRQIEKSNRQRVRMSRILCALALAAVLCCCLQAFWAADISIPSHPRRLHCWVI